MTRRTEFPHFPACGIRNEGWTTNQACSLPLWAIRTSPRVLRVGSLTFWTLLCVESIESFQTFPSLVYHFPGLPGNDSSLV